MTLNKGQQITLWIGLGFLFIASDTSEPRTYIFATLLITAFMVIAQAPGFRDYFD